MSYPMDPQKDGLNSKDQQIANLSEKQFAILNCLPSNKKPLRKRWHCGGGKLRVPWTEFSSLLAGSLSFFWHGFVMVLYGFIMDVFYLTFVFSTCQWHDHFVFFYRNSLNQKTNSDAHIPTCDTG